jgi:hypothetical protein
MRAPSAPAVAVWAVVLVAGVSRAAHAQEPVPPSCTASSFVHRALISVVSDDTLLTGKPLPVRVTAPVLLDAVAAMDPTGATWALVLPDSARADSLAVVLRVPHFRATPVAATRVEARDGACVARLAYRVARVWMIEVGSRPEGLRVQVEAATDSCGLNLDERTSFRTPAVNWAEPVLVRVYLSERESFSQRFSATRFRAAGDSIRLTREDIAERMCQEHSACPNMITRMLHGLLVGRSRTEEVRFTLVVP